MLPEKIFLKLITKPFLSELVGEQVGEYSVKTGSNQGDNVAGSLLAVDIRTVSRKIHHIVIKTPPYDNPSSYMYVEYWRVFDLENRFYGFLVPELEKLYRIKNPESSSSFNLPIPKYLGGTADYLALEDVRPLGYRMADKYKGLDVHEVTLVMKNLGKLHASTHAYIKENGERLFTEEKNKVFNNRLIHNHWMPEIDKVGEDTFSEICLKGLELLAKRNPGVGQKLLRFYKNPNITPAQRMLATYYKTDKNYFPVISHGDIWGNNLIFTYETVYDKEGKPYQRAKECMLLDFQQTRRENIFWDLIYFMYTSTTPEWRKDHLMSALSTYYESFVETLRKFKTPVPLNFTRGWLVDEFYANVPNAFAYIPFAISLQLGDFVVLGLESPKPVDVEEKLKEVPWEDFYGDFVNMCLALLGNTKEAMDRLEAIAMELDALRLFD